MNSELKKAVDEVTAGYTVDNKTLIDGADLFVQMMKEGLASSKPQRLTMPMIPTFVTAVPSGKEKGLYLAGDLGGTNFRVCSVQLNGDHTFNLEQQKTKIPQDLMTGAQGLPLFRYLAEKIGLFIKEHHQNYCTEENDNRLKLGLTFSFPVDQTALHQGSLIRWTKGFDLPDVVGRDVVGLLQIQLDELTVPVDVVALANDTVGTLLSRAYSNDESKTKANTVVGCIFGTGTNGAYYESRENIKKINVESKGMAINTEWGSFDNGLKVLPNTKYDQIVDAETANPGYHLFEKRISGMFLGELLRVTLKDLADRELLFCDLKKERGGSLPHRLVSPWQLDSQVLSYLEIDDSTNLKMSQLILENELRLKTTPEERIAIQEITRAISKRAALLSSIPISAIVKHVKHLYKHDDNDFEIGCDGSVVEFFPGFKERIYEGIKIINPLSDSKKKIVLTIAKDGSGVGAALCASVA